MLNIYIYFLSDGFSSLILRERKTRDVNSSSKSDGAVLLQVQVPEHPWGLLAPQCCTAPQLAHSCSNVGWASAGNMCPFLHLLYIHVHAHASACINAYTYMPACLLGPSGPAFGRKVIIFAASRLMLGQLVIWLWLCALMRTFDYTLVEMKVFLLLIPLPFSLIWNKEPNCRSAGPHRTLPLLFLLLLSKIFQSVVAVDSFLMNIKISCWPLPRLATRSSSSFQTQWVGELWLICEPDIRLTRVVGRPLTFLGALLRNGACFTSPYATIKPSNDGFCGRDLLLMTSKDGLWRLAYE